MIIIGNNNKINDEEYEEPILEIDCNIISKLTNAIKILFNFNKNKKKEVKY